MDETQRDHEQAINPEWAEKIRSNLEDALTEEVYPFFDKLVNISPAALTYDEDPRTFNQATPAERAFLVRILFETVGFNPVIADLERTYKFQSPDPSIWQGEADVRVYKTTRHSQHQYFHEIHFPDGRVEYAIAPLDKNI